MAFTYDLTTPVGKIRLEVGDTVLNKGIRPDRSNFSDAELTYFLGEEDDDISLAVARACEVLSRQWSAAADLQVGPRKESYSQISANYAARATSLRNQAVQTGILVLSFQSTMDE